MAKGKLKETYYDKKVELAPLNHILRVEHILQVEPNHMAKGTYYDKRVEHAPFNVYGL